MPNAHVYRIKSDITSLPQQRTVLRHAEGDVVDGRAFPWGAEGLPGTGILYGNKNNKNSATHQK